MSGFVPINGTSIDLNAYATSGLPIEYNLITGSDVVSLTNNQDGTWTIAPLAIGYATIVAYQPGNDAFKPALPIVKIIRVIGLPDPDNLEVVARVLDTPSNLLEVKARLAVGSEPPSNLRLITIPLEPTSVHIGSVGPKAPSRVRVQFTPEAVSNVDAVDYADLPPRDLSFVGAFEITAPDSVSEVDAVSLIPPKMLYAYNLSYYPQIDESPIISSLDLDGYNPNDVWDETNLSTEETEIRKNFRKTQASGLNYISSPLWKFENDTRLDYREFAYENVYHPEMSGKYSGPYNADTLDRTKMYWRQETTAGQNIVNEANRHYMYFVAIQFEPFYISRRELSFIGDADIMWEQTYNYFMTNEYYNRYKPHNELFSMFCLRTIGRIPKRLFSETYLTFTHEFTEPEVSYWTNYSDTNNQRIGTFVVDKDLSKPRLRKYSTLTLVDNEDNLGSPQIK